MGTSLETESIIGPLGSEFYRIKVPAIMREAINWDYDWNKLGKRVMIDASAGIITWMSPGTTHEGAAAAADKIVMVAGMILNCPTVDRRGTRWKIPGGSGKNGPDKIEVEADASFYIGQKAEGFYTARKRGIKAAKTYVGQNPPDLVVEAEVTHFDARKPAHYKKLGAREMWQLTYDDELDAYEATILDLQAEGGPRPIAQSMILPGLKASRLPKIYEMAETSGLPHLNALLKKEIIVPVPPSRPPPKPKPPGPSTPRM